MEQIESVQIESSREDESPEKGLESLQLASELEVAPEKLSASSPELSPTLLPTADAPVTQVITHALLPGGHTGPIFPKQPETAFFLSYKKDHKIPGICM